jgi:hypothetical protein
MGECEAKMSITSLVIGNVHKRLSLMNFEWHKNYRVLKTLRGTLENPNLCPME